MIHLSLKLFPWAYWHRSGASAVKRHTLLTLHGPLPTWATMTEASLPELKLLDALPLQPGAFYVMNRGYLDFARLWRWPQAGAFFVIRNKRHVRWRTVAIHPVDKAQGLRSDPTVRLQSAWSQKSYPQPLRRIRFRDVPQQRTFVFLTNHFDLSAEVICELYRRRWQVELFFKWIKQPLRLRHF